MSRLIREICDVFHQYSLNRYSFTFIRIQMTICQIQFEPLEFELNTWSRYMVSKLLCTIWPDAFFLAGEDVASCLVTTDQCSVGQCDNMHGHTNCCQSAC